MKTKITTLVISLFAFALALTACQPVSSDPIVADPASVGFEALPPPPGSGLVLPNPDKTTILFTTGEECAWAGDAAEGGVPLAIDGKPISFTCGEMDGNQIVLLGEFASVQGQAFSVARAILAPAEITTEDSTDEAPVGEMTVAHLMQLPFTVLDILLTNGATCFATAEGDAQIIDDAHVSFTCQNAVDQPDTGATTVLLNGIYANADGEFMVEAANMTQEGDDATLQDVREMSIASITAQPLIVSVSQGEGGKTVTLAQNQILEITLESNTTTGYHWELTPTSTAPVTLAADAEFVPDSDADGAGGVEILRFDVAGVGSGTLELEYVMESGDEAAEQTFTLEVVVALTLADAGTEVAIQQGQTLALSLPGNPSTGFAWQVVEIDNAVLAQTGDAAIVRPSSLLGAGGMQTIPFEGIAAGTSTLTLAYARPGETGVAPAATFSVTVTVE